MEGVEFFIQALSRIKSGGNTLAIFLLLQMYMLSISGPRHEKTRLRRLANNTGFRPACASVQSDQRLCYSLFGKYHM